MSEISAEAPTAFNWRLQPAPRPNGAGLIAFGIGFIIVGILLAAVGALMPDVLSSGSAGYGDIIPATPVVYNTWKWPIFWGGSGLTSLGFSLWGIGQVIRAMFFLPGRIVRQGEVVGTKIDRDETERLLTDSSV